MKKILMAAVALTAITASPAFATVSDTVATYSISGSVGAICSASATGSIDLGALVDSNGVLANSGGTASDATAYCNGAGTKITVTHTALTTAGAAAAGFTNSLTFTPTVQAGAGALLTGNQTATALGAFSGLTVNVTSLNSTGLKPVAGTYAGQIVVTLTPGA